MWRRTTYLLILHCRDKNELRVNQSIKQTNKQSIIHHQPFPSQERDRQNCSFQCGFIRPKPFFRQRKARWKIQDYCGYKENMGVDKICIRAFPMTQIERAVSFLHEKSVIPRAKTLYSTTSLMRVFVGV